MTDQETQNAEELKALHDVAREIVWPIDLDQAKNVLLVKGTIYQLDRVVEQGPADEDADVDNPRVVDKVYWDLFSGQADDLHFRRRFWINGNTPADLLVLHVRVYVANDIKSRRPGTYRISSDRIEVVSLDSLGGEIIELFAANSFLSARVHELFGGSATVYQLVRASYETVDRPLVQAGPNSKFPDEVICVDHAGKLSFVYLAPN
jgi:hypothetical protein